MDAPASEAARCADLTPKHLGSPSFILIITAISIFTTIAIHIRTLTEHARLAVFRLPERICNMIFTMQRCNSAAEGVLSRSLPA